jgi:putative transcriptional regulator
MDISLLRKKSSGKGFLNDHFLVAMPNMGDDRFARSVIYICAHSEDGAMGFIINQPQKLDFPALLVQIGLVNEEDAIKLPDEARDFVVRSGGPVDKGRGFVIHTDDYMVNSTLPVSENICLTATVDILRAISGGKGPAKALMTLGYSGWAPGQLEQEIAQNGWLTCPATHNVLFDENIARTYERALAMIGVDPTRLSHEVGHA